MCPFDAKIKCDNNAKFRTLDGSCNNLQKPMWGSANTPYERFTPPDYDDGFGAPRIRSIYGNALPSARVISSQVVNSSAVADLHFGATIVTMTLFGQLIGHEENETTFLAAYDGRSLTCCNADGTTDNSAFKRRLGCFPIEFPPNDPKFGETCMSYVRASATPSLDCELGYRQQLNILTSFLDASFVYGSNTETMNAVRLNRGGLLKVPPSSNGDLTRENPASTGTAGCRTTGCQRRFKAGDSRGNKQPDLVTLQTIFLREHNRIAKNLKEINPLWKDERLFQEARKIVGAELQHVTYNEFLPVILGNTSATRFGFAPQPAGSCFTGYEKTFNPAIRNGFAAAFEISVRDPMVCDISLDLGALNILLGRFQLGGNGLAAAGYRTGHSSVRDAVARGIALDLVAFNIQLGRDHGVANYNFWRHWCGLEPAATFIAGTGGLIDHKPAIAKILGDVYGHPDDIDLYTGIVTETPLERRSVGPTGACLIGRQFWVLKHADRFYYETSDAAAKFKMGQLDQIRKTRFAKIICDNNGIKSLPADAFQELSASNPKVQCSSLPSVDLKAWADCDKADWSSKDRVKCSD